MLLEVLLKQIKWEACSQFLDEALTDTLFISDFTLHSIGVILLGRKQGDLYLRFVNDLLPELGIMRLRKEIFTFLADTFNPKRLDYDDFYQYWVAVEEGLTLVTLDSDFKKVSKDIPVVFL